MEQKPFLIPVDQPHYPVNAFSHKGLVRNNNEDSFITKAFQSRRSPAANIILAAVADGVGGHKAGEIASRIAVETIHAFIANCGSLENPGNLLAEAFIAANQEIVRQAQTHAEWNGMGTTCVCALIIDDRMHIANQGDSRLYLIREREIHQLTYDHTWMEEFSSAELPLDRNHPLSHVLNRYLGSNEPIQVDLRIRMEDENETAHNGLALQAGDIIALTSDGISDMLSDNEIRLNLTGRRGERVARRLVYCALKNGGHDNATAVTIQIPRGA